jgi:multisubunit Na+/H+ antiporter MnhG subunit
VRLDIRMPIGSMFLLLGALLVAYGALGDPAVYRRSLGINVNLWWGSVLVVVGGLMLALARRARR